MENENRTSTNADKITENKKVVKGSEIIDVTNDGAANVEEIARINRGIGNRITEIRENAGMTQEDFYSLLYPTSNETTTTKRKRMGEIENAKAFSDKPTGAKLIDFGRLLFISQRFQVSLDYLLYGKTEQTAETPPTMQESPKMQIRIPRFKIVENTESFAQKIDAIRRARAIDYFFQLQDGDEISILPLVDALLVNTEKAPIMQMSASILNLFNYADISIVGNYEENNFRIPQSLTIKITPKHELVLGIPESYKQSHKLHLNFTEDQENTAQNYTFWDIRASLAQRLLAIACKSKGLNIFDPAVMLQSNLLEMSKRNIEISQERHFLDTADSDNLFNLNYHSRFLEAFENNDLYLDTSIYGYHDPMFYARSCPSDKVPADVE